jgi:hypothetical protein
MRIALSGMMSRASADRLNNTLRNAPKQETGKEV